MRLTEELRRWIDSLPYDNLLRRWRFAAAGDAMFEGESGDYWAKRMQDLRIAGADHVGASKRIGWRTRP